MNLGDWRVEVIRDIPGFSLNRIFMYQRLQHGSHFVTHNGEIVLVKEGETINRDELYFAEMDDVQLQAFANALADKGIKTTNDHKNEGLLVATKAHLEDMRSLVFKGKQL